MRSSVHAHKVTHPSHLGVCPGLLSSSTILHQMPQMASCTQMHDDTAGHPTWLPTHGHHVHIMSTGLVPSCSHVARSCLCQQGPLASSSPSNSIRYAVCHAMQCRPCGLKQPTASMTDTAVLPMSQLWPRTAWQHMLLAHHHCGHRACEADTHPCSP